ncbi:MAG: hypothetical protein RR280_08460 [Bacteroidaceae bacterium]
MRKTFFAIGAMALVVMLALDVKYTLDGHNLIEKISATEGTSTATQGTTAGYGDGECHYTEEIRTAKSLYVTKITGSVGADVTIGMRLANGITANLRGKIEADERDEYMIICYSKSGFRCCTKQDWVRCASGGCPKQGKFKS